MSNFNVTGKANSVYDWTFYGAQQKVYPTGDAGVTVTANAAAWTLGSYAEIVAASTITNDFQITGVGINAVSGAGVHQLTLYAGTDVVADVRYPVLGTPASQVLYPLTVSTTKIDANTQIQAKLQTSSTNADTVTISIEYQEL